MVFRWRPIKRNLYRKEVKRETLKEYKDWVKKLIDNWRIIEWIICDWKRWLLNGFPWIPVQMCHFHQRQIITRYITKRPKLEENIELKDISKFIWKLRKTLLNNG